MSEMVLIDRTVAGHLVAGALHKLYSGLQPPQSAGCCRKHCSPCWALDQLQKSGQLDDLMTACVDDMSARDNDETYDSARGGVDLDLLHRGWSAPQSCCETS